MRRRDERAARERPIHVNPPRPYYENDQPVYDNERMRPPRQHSHMDEEGVEVVLKGSLSSVEDSGHPAPPPSQNVFRPRNAPPPTVRPRAVRPGRPYHGPSPPGGHSHHFGYSSRRHNMPPVQYNISRSFEDRPQGSHPYTPHYSYQPRHPDDVNVVSPYTREGSRWNGPPPRAERGPPPPPPSNHHYPPASPVSQHAGKLSPPRCHRGPDPAYSSSHRDEYYSYRRRPEEGSWNAYHGRNGYDQSPLVHDGSFDSEPHHPHRVEEYASPYSNPYSQSTPPVDPHQPHQPPYQGGSWDNGSFDLGAPPYFDDQRYYGYPAEQQPQQQYDYHEPRPHYEEDVHPLFNEYQDHDGDTVGRPGINEEERNVRNFEKDDRGLPPKSSHASGLMPPKAAGEVDFPITSPPLQPVVLPSELPACETSSDVNSNDVLCGRGGGTNSQVGNRRFRQLVQEFQPTYLMARRKEKPLIARSIVLIIRKRGGRFLKKDDDTSALFEVGDAKAEAKTSQALREGLDVRATRSGKNGDKKKKKKDGPDKPISADIKSVTSQESNVPEDVDGKESPSPPTEDIPLVEKEEEQKEKPRENVTPPRQQEQRTGVVHPLTPEALQLRKRRRVPLVDKESAEPVVDALSNDDQKLFMDFCPPRASLARTGSPTLEDNKEDGKEEDHPPVGCGIGAVSMIMEVASSTTMCFRSSQWGS